MFNLKQLPDSVVSFIKNTIAINTNRITCNELPEFAFYIKYSITTYNVTLLLIVFLIILNFISNLFFKNISICLKIVKYINMVLFSVILALVMIKFYIALKVESVLGHHFYSIKLDFYKENNNLGYLEHFTTFSSSFSDAILLLSLIIGLLCLELLSSKNLFKSISNINIFYLFTFFVTIMVSTNNLLIMFVSFEFIFLPTIYYAYTLGYSKKIDKSTEILFYWTLFGSLLVLCSLSYLYYKYNTLNYMYLSQKQFSKAETQFLFINFLIGFGIKIPLAPFHFWLLKVHVESPTAFSIFLSGFLVKSALYCLFMLINIFNNNSMYTSLITWVLYSLVIGTLGLSRQTDIKKLIAWATIQEMSFILMFLLFKQVFLSHTCILFMVLHGLMSAYMFYIVDILQRRFKTRSLQYIRGINLLYPKLTKYLWFLIFLFSGFPFTAKFFLEWSLVALLIETHKITLLVVLFLVNFLGVLFFCKAIFTIIYGSAEGSKDHPDLLDIQKKEEGLLKYLSLMIVLLLALIYIIKW